MSFKDHFSTQADSYARYRPHYPAELYTYLASLPAARQLAWDCATGSGQAAVALAESFTQVIATDASPQQLQRAQPHPRVSYQVATAEAVALADASVDLITVAQALHWFDLDAFASEAGRVLKPGGILAVWTYEMARIQPQVDAIVEHFYRDIVGPWWPPERALVESGYADIQLPFSELDTPAFQMQADWTLQQLTGYLSSWSAVQRYRDEKGEHPIDTVMDALNDAWGTPDHPRTVRWPLALRVYQTDLG